MQLLILAVLSLVATVIVWRSFPESPRRLESCGRYAEVERVMRIIEERAAQHTDKPPSPVVFEDDGEASHTVPYSALLTGVLLRRVILGSLVLIATNVA